MWPKKTVGTHDTKIRRNGGMAYHGPWLAPEPQRVGHEQQQHPGIFVKKIQITSCSKNPTYPGMSCSYPGKQTLHFCSFRMGLEPSGLFDPGGVDLILRVHSLVACWNCRGDHRLVRGDLMSWNYCDRFAFYRVFRYVEPKKSPKHIMCHWVMWIFKLTKNQGRVSGLQNISQKDSGIMV